MKTDLIEKDIKVLRAAASVLSILEQPTVNASIDRIEEFMRSASGPDGRRLMGSDELVILPLRRTGSDELVVDAPKDGLNAFRAAKAADDVFVDRTILEVSEGPRGTEIKIEKPYFTELTAEKEELDRLRLELKAKIVAYEQLEKKLERFVEDPKHPSAVTVSRSWYEKAARRLDEPDGFSRALRELEHERNRRRKAESDLFEVRPTIRQHEDRILALSKQVAELSEQKVGQQPEPKS